MNSIFSKYLRQFVLLFFDDMLIYSKSHEEHIERLKIVLNIFRVHDLKAKISKCQFEKSQIEYLGRIISGKGVASDPSKIQTLSICQYLSASNN
jgi:hypothetical protein